MKIEFDEQEVDKLLQVCKSKLNYYKYWLPTMQTICERNNWDPSKDEDIIELIESCKIWKTINSKLKTAKKEL